MTKQHKSPFFERRGLSIYTEGRFAARGYVSGSASPVVHMHGHAGMTPERVDAMVARLNAEIGQ